MIPSISLFLLIVSPVESWELENEDGGFLSEGDTAQWEWGAVESGPHSSHDGSNAWATILDGDYLNDSVDTLQLPPLDLGSLDRPVLQFAHWIEIDQEGDMGTIEVQQDGTWTEISPIYGYPFVTGFTGSSGDWKDIFLDLTGLANLSQVRLRFSADESVARSGWIVDDFQLWDGDPVPPRIHSISELSDTQVLERGQTVEASIEDDQSVSGASLQWQTDDGQSGNVAMLEIETDLWTAEFPVFEPGTTVQWAIEATDGESDSTEGPWTYRVFLAAPEGLIGPEERTVDLEVEIQWESPPSDYPVMEYLVYRSGSLDLVTADTSATIIAGANEDIFTVSAVFETPLGEREGDASEGLVLDLFAPQIRAISPTYAWPGDQLRLEIRGDYLLFSQDDALVDLGVDVELVEVDVLDVDTAFFLLDIASSATPGLRNLTVHSGDLSVVETDAFTVLSDTDRPTLLSVSPDALEQGDSATICIELNTPLEGDALRVDLGEGVYIENIWSEGRTVWVDLVVDPSAPIGLHAVVLDDGVRLREGVSLRVRDHREPVQTVCASISSGSTQRGMWIPIACMLILGARRKMAPGRDSA